MKTKNAKTTKTLKTLKTAAPAKAPAAYTGRLPATKVYSRPMPEFKNCTAETYMLINETAGVYTFANTYNGILKSNYDPAPYTFQLNDKNRRKVNTKADLMTEIEVADWPEWIENAAGAVAPKKRGRKPALAAK